VRNISNRNLPEGMNKMREKAINEARRMKSKSQSLKGLSKGNYKNEGKNFPEAGKLIEVKEEDNKVIKSSEQNTKKNKNTPPNMKGLSSIVSRFLSDSDSALIIILILLLMDEEENFLILLVLLYLLM